MKIPSQTKREDGIGLEAMCCAELLMASIRCGTMYHKDDAQSFPVEHLVVLQRSVHIAIAVFAKGIMYDSHALL